MWLAAVRSLTHLEHLMDFLEISLGLFYHFSTVCFFLLYLDVLEIYLEEWPGLVSCLCWRYRDRGGSWGSVVWWHVNVTNVVVSFQLSHLQLSAVVLFMEGQLSALAVHWAEINPLSKYSRGSFFSKISPLGLSTAGKSFLVHGCNCFAYRTKQNRKKAGKKISFLFPHLA